MKSRETFAPTGPYIVTADEIKDPHNLQVRLWVNGTLMQNYNTSDMAHKIPRCIEWISSIHPLEPGDVLALGTNHRGLSPFQDGDLVELETEPLGRLHVKIRDDLKRTWAPASTPRHSNGSRSLSCSTATLGPIPPLSSSPAPFDTAAPPPTQGIRPFRVARSAHRGTRGRKHALSCVEGSGGLDRLNDLNFSLPGGNHF
jgi:hypothetical protein